MKFYRRVYTYSPILLSMLFLCKISVTASDEELCGPSESYVQNYKLRIISHGCIQRELHFVENIVDFTYCCDRHAACYQTCGLTKPYCDEDMKVCMDKVCRAILGDSRICEANAESFYAAIVSSDYELFHRNQGDYCACHDTESIEQYYGTVVRDFYSKFAPDMVTKTEYAIKLYKSKYVHYSMLPTYSYAKLYYDLHKKYDVAIGLSPYRKSIEDFPDPSQLWKRRLDSQSVSVD